jgi:hypothetical protein
MARGTTRAPSQNAYRGQLGKTQTKVVLVAGPQGELITTQVITSIDAVSDPELVERLHADTLNPVSVPLVYHDPAAELLVLILADAHRHRELDERIAVLEALRDGGENVPVYAKNFAVVYGTAGLRAYLEGRAQQALEAARVLESTRDLDKRVRDLDKRAGELDSAKADLATKAVEVERVRADVMRDRAEVERLRSEARNRVIAAVQTAPVPVHIQTQPLPVLDQRPNVSSPVHVDGEPTIIGAPPSARTGNDVSAITMPVPRELLEEPEDVLTKPTNGHSRHVIIGEPSDQDGEDVAFDIETSVVRALDALDGAPAAEPQGKEIIPPGSDPLTTETHELPMDIVSETWLERALTSATSTFAIDAHGNVRLALVAGDQITRGFNGQVDVRVLLHRTATYPVITFVLGPPAALRVPSPTQLVLVPLDIAGERDRQVLAALAKKFEIIVELISRGRRIRRFRIAAPLQENVGYIMRAAEDHLRGVQAEGDPSIARARELVQGAGYDLLGTDQPDAAEFRDDKLAQLQTAQQLRRAISMARRFARPSREDYLVCSRGFPLPRWRELRRHVLESAVAWGLWMGPELAQVAVSEGLARSRRDLVQKLDRGFEQLKRDPVAFDIDEEAANDNAKALADEAKALGVELGARAPAGGAIKTSEEGPQVSGSIGQTPAKGTPRLKPSEDLLALLEDKQHRMAAAMELCERAEARAAAPVIDAVQKMSRAEAVRVLGMSVKFGDAAKAPLMQGLASSKAFLRHGCALALALLRTEDGTQAVIDLLLTEPTEIWREVARAIGQVGPTALLPLASTYGRLGDKATPAVEERVAWAMAHVAVRGGKGAVETMAGGQSVVAPVAKHALELHASAAKDQTRVRPGAEGSQAGRDVTVNRAFSRKFFESLEQGIPDAGQAGLEALEASGPMEVLDEADVIMDDEDADEELDESDLIQS